ncbi:MULTISPECIES: hypothetical protein [Pseudomonas]|uniref:Transposase n=1 Tax=Pseudomonas mosselii TaxID=78327 RepID=A0ABX9B768_9PSED|nr:MULTISPECIES: hypothetical protein [Pseudomonas]MBC3458391.1 hypothetical protein [Pseudomonas mosselii]MBS9763049.1 hypothetical protein [Pseudomonas mosselii]MCL8340907.1 hypothetical protein [Pseudomonas mosselii]MCU9530573.1 hypothetical protein [Pseudomonas mosselii]MCU9535792.1 hypothetical protein [Pseudomonas mosselii]
MPELALYKVKLLDEFEAREDDWSFSHFERRLTQVKPAANYQDAKGIIKAAHLANNWPKTVRRYLLSNYRFHGNVSSELTETFVQVLAGMTPLELQAWRLPPAGYMG